LAAGYSQKQLAQQAGLGLRGVNDLERGERLKPHPETVRLLADALSLTGSERAAFFAAAQPQAQEQALDQETLPVANNISLLRANDIRPHNLPAGMTPLAGRRRAVADIRALPAWRDGPLTGPEGAGKTRLGAHSRHSRRSRRSRMRSKSVWMMPYLRNQYFVGRESVLTRLHAVLSGHEVGAVNQIRALSGLGGIGKTQTAIEYVYRYGGEYDLALWTLADSRATLVEQLAGLASELGVAQQRETDQNRLAKAVKRWLETKHDLVWLLIFDNVEDVQVVQEFLPTRGTGAVLLTTRLRNLGPHIRAIALDPMTLEEGVQFLQARLDAGKEQEQQPLSEAEREAANQLWTLLGGLPLALDQAAAFAQETGNSLAEYCALLRQARGALLRRRGLPASDHLDSVAATFAMAWNQIDQLSPAAAALLRLCAFLAPAAIPEELFFAGADAAPAELREALEEPLGWQEMIGLLRRYSLLEREGATKSLSVHRLVQAALREELDQETQRRWAKRVIRLVNAAFPQVAPETWPQCERLLPQAMQATEWIEQYQATDEVAIRLMFETGHYLRDRGRYAEAEPLYQRTLQAREQLWGSEHPQVAEALVKLGALSREQGKFPEAERLCQQALDIWERQEGEPEYPQVAEALNNLAISYNSRGKYAEAEQFHLRALAICEQRLGSTHHDTARSLNNLANLYQFHGRYREAEPLYTRALDIWERQLGSENTRLTYPLTGLGTVYHNLGRFPEGESHFRRALRIWDAQTGPEHPQVTYVLTGLGNLFQEQGRYAEAESCYQRALRIWEEQMEPEHPERAGTLSGLASLYARQGKYAEARWLYQRTLRIWEEQMGPEHLVTAETMRALAELEEAQGAGEEARSSYQRAMALRDQALERVSSSRTEAYRHLIATLRAIGHFEEAARIQTALSQQEENADS
jgi:tetratricopeptide (TPR) repeat protein/transcriptional regulator with XRE-family HTH domain